MLGMCSCLAGAERLESAADENSMICTTSTATCARPLRCHFRKSVDGIAYSECNNKCAKCTGRRSSAQHKSTDFRNAARAKRLKTRRVITGSSGCKQALNPLFVPLPWP